MFDQIKQHLQALEAAVTARDIPGTLHAFGDVSHDAGDLAGLFFATPPGAEADPAKDECKDCCERIKAAAAGAPEPVASGPQPVGAWGDGTFLKLVLPVFLDWLVKWFEK